MEERELRYEREITTEQSLLQRGISLQVSSALLTAGVLTILKSDLLSRRMTALAVLAILMPLTASFILSFWIRISPGRAMQDASKEIILAGIREQNRRNRRLLLSAGICIFVSLGLLMGMLAYAAVTG